MIQHSQYFSRGCSTIQDAGRQQDVTSWGISDAWLTCPGPLMPTMGTRLLDGNESSLSVSNLTMAPTMA